MTPYQLWLWFSKPAVTRSKAQEISDRLERLAIGLYCLRKREDRLGLAHYDKPQVYKIKGEFFNPPPANRDRKENS